MFRMKTEVLVVVSLLCSAAAYAWADTAQEILGVSGIQGGLVVHIGCGDAGLTVSLRQMFGQEELTSTKMRVVVQQYPDGPGLYGLQVRVSCKGIKSYVAGTTDRDGKFVCELPVRAQSGLTYDVDVTWPREEGGDTERKSITLHADRTHFVLPFYRRLNPSDEVDAQG